MIRLARIIRLTRIIRVTRIIHQNLSILVFVRDSVLFRVIGVNVELCGESNINNIIRGVKWNMMSTFQTLNMSKGGCMILK